jgi:hypothetical protein
VLDGLVSEPVARLSLLGRLGCELAKMLSSVSVPRTFAGSSSDFIVLVAVQFHGPLATQGSDSSVKAVVVARFGCLAT